MDEHVGAFEVRRRFGELLDRVVAGDPVVVERHGKPVAAVVPIALYERWRAERESFFDALRSLAARADMDEDEALALAREAQRAVRDETPGP